MAGEVTLTISQGIGTIEFFHPKGNSLPSQLLNELCNAIDTAGSNSEVSVVVLRSKGSGAFCAGASFDELLAIENDEKARVFFSGFGRVISSMKNCPKFIVCRVQGKAVGGGVGLIAASDYAIASEAASVKLSELSIGFGPFVIAPAVIRKIGVSAFSTLTVDSKKWKSSSWALEKGLFNSVEHDEAALDNSLNELATSLSSYSNEAMMHIKTTFWEGFEDLETELDQRARLSGKLSQSDATQHILSAIKKS